MAARSKAERRLLAFLHRHRTARCSPFADDKTALLTAADGARLTVAQAALSQLERDGLTLRRAELLELTETGIAAAKRATAGEDEFVAQHRTTQSKTLMMDHGVSHTVSINCNESPLSRLATRNARNGQPYLRSNEYEAGERLRADFERGQLRQSVTSRWDVGTGRKRSKGTAGGGVDVSDTAIDARQRLQAALDDVGPELAGVLQDVCCHLKGLEIVERDRQWPPRSAKLMLRTGLRLLARHYGTIAGTGRKPTRTRHWKAESR